MSEFCDICSGNGSERILATHVCKVCGAKRCTLCASQHMYFFELMKHEMQRITKPKETGQDA